MKATSNIAHLPVQNMDESISLATRITATLAPRELEAAKLIACGHINKDVADRMAAGLKTIETHRQEIYRRLRPLLRIKVTSAAHLAHLLLWAGLIENVFKSYFVSPDQLLENAILTERQTDVIVLTSYGYPDKATAERLGIGNKTVQTHRARASQRLRTLVENKELTGAAHLAHLLLRARVIRNLFDPTSTFNSDDTDRSLYENGPF
jgi:DNA-binding NarL/FixJ family response regulator